jgi:hypothetical protein
MLGLERFAHKFLYEYHYLGNFRVHPENLRNAVKECGLRFRAGKDIEDIWKAIWGFGAPHGYDKHMEWALERLDKVLGIDWVQVYRNKYGLLRI